MNESDGSHAPDWRRFGIKPPNAGNPVGDPTRWGVQVITPLVDVNPPKPIYTGQILQIATRDGYSRSWSLVGTLGLNGVIWNGVGSPPQIQVEVSLEVTMGVGQAQMTQQIGLLVPAVPKVAPEVSIPAGGLCVTQFFDNGGPFLYSGTFDGAPVIYRSFAIVGGLVGSSIQVRARDLTAPFPPTTGLPSSAILTLIATPYAAGEGL